MATVVNARDVLLQAAGTRVANVSMAPNLQVSQTQVTGLGLALANTRTIELQSTAQVFQIPKTGSVAPASITLKAIAHNIAGAPSLSITSGTMSSTPVLVAGTVTIPYANFTSDSVTIRVTAVDGSDTFTDDVTIIKVREGIDSFNGLLTNESHTLASDYLGNVLSYTGAGGTFKVFQGAVDITTLCTFSLVANPSSLTYTLNAATGVYAVTGGYPTGTDITTMTFRATIGTVTIDKVLTIAKSKAGVAGVRGSRTYYVTLTGATNTFSDSLATTTVTADGGPILNDTVTQSNASVGFSQTKFWTGSAWAVVNAVVDGNLLVSGTVGAPAMVANLMQSDNVLTRNMTVRDAQGNVIMSAGTNIMARNCIPSLKRWSNSATTGTGTGWNGSGDGTYLHITAASNLDPAVSPAISLDPGVMLIQFRAYTTAGGTRTLTFEGVGGPVATWSVTGGDKLYTAVITIPSGATGVQPRLYSPAHATDGIVLYNVSLTAGSDIRPWKPAVEDFLSSTNQLTASNVSSFLASAAIGDAYIGNFIKSYNFNGTIDGSGNITALGTAGWAIGKGGTIVANNGYFRGDLTGATGTFSGSLNVASATSGARTTITNSVIKVYDSSGVVRVKLGDLS